MAGNNSKKTTERRDSSFTKQQQRKNSTGGAGVKKEPTTQNSNNNTKILNPKAQQAAGAAILSAVTSPKPSDLIQPQQRSVGANGFNREELIEFLNMRFSGVLTAYHDTNLDPKMRPETYQSSKPATTSAWGKNNNGVPSAWGQQSSQQAKDSNEVLANGVMANGSDFLSELNKKF